MIIKAYLNRLTLAGYRPRTIKAREQCLRTFEGTLAPHRITTATRYDLESYLARPLAPESRKTYRSHLQGFFAFCAEEGILTDDPSLRLPTVRVPRAVPRPLSGDHLALALDRADSRMRAWLLLMSLGGLRCLEVAGLRPSDLLTSGGETLLFLRECKGGGSATVPAHPAILQALAVVPVRNGLWWSCTPLSVSRNVAVHLRSLGIPATAHALRHTAGTSWYKASGHDLLTTANLLRHASVQTAQVYAQLDPTRPAEVVGLVSLPKLKSAS